VIGSNRAGGLAMLTAFTARPIIELRQRDKSKIETILAYGKELLHSYEMSWKRSNSLNDSR
jgi:hypothetical protein